MRVHLASTEARQQRCRKQPNREVPDELRAKHVELNFGATFYRTRVWLGLNTFWITRNDLNFDSDGIGTIARRNIDALNHLPQ